MLSKLHSLFIICCLGTVAETTDNCLAKKESGIMQSMQQSLKTLAKDMSQLESSLKGKSVVQYGDGCQKGWKRFRDFCYYFSNDKTTWFLAERYCRSHGSSLVDVTDKTENEWLASKITTDSSFLFWLGGSDMRKHQWLWNASFKPLTYTNWNSGEPNGHGATCIHMIGKKEKGFWNDHSCDTKIQFVCKKALKCDCEGGKMNRG